MKNKRRASKVEKINPHFWIFCEGETEKAYISFLRSEYPLPIEIIPKIAGSSINERFIISYKKGKPRHEKDKDFLIYDSDILEIFYKSIKIDSAILIASNPSIELWFLLHNKNITTTLSTDDCIRELCNRSRNNYKKGFLDNPLKNRLKEKCVNACNRSKQLKMYNNPSTNMFEFIEVLEKVKKEL